MSMSPRLRESPKRRALGDITNIVDKKNPKITDGKQNVTVNIATVKKDTEAAAVGVDDVAKAAVMEVDQVEDDSDLSIISVPEKLVPPPRHEASPEWDYREEIYISMRQCEENCSVQVEDLPAWFDKQNRAKLIECLTEIQIWNNFDYPTKNANILQEILFKTVSTIER